MALSVPKAIFPAPTVAQVLVRPRLRRRSSIHRPDLDRLRINGHVT
jgi:hypothetical protein